MQTQSYVVYISLFPVAVALSVCVPVCSRSECVLSHFSTVLWTPPLTSIDNDCIWNESIKAASLTRLQSALWLWDVHQAGLFTMHPLLLTIPLTHVMCIMGLMVYRLEWAVRARSHLVSSGLFFFFVLFGLVWFVFFSMADELGHRSHVFAEGVCPVFADLCEGWHLELFFMHFVCVWGGGT